MGNPIKDTVDDFDVDKYFEENPDAFDIENSPFTDVPVSCPESAAVEHMRNTHAEMLNKMLLEDLEEEPFDLIDIPEMFPWEHEKNIKRMKKAVKNDKEKPRMSLNPPNAILAMARAMTYGGKKYADYNYKRGIGLDWDQYVSALLRHVTAWWGGEEYDPESGLRHTDHILACAAMLSDAVESNIGKDTRYDSVDD